MTRQPTAVKRAREPSVLEAVEYDIFEQFADGSTLWRDCEIGIQSAQDALNELATHTNNTCYAMNIQTQEIIARVNHERTRNANS